MVVAVNLDDENTELSSRPASGRCSLSSRLLSYDWLTSPSRRRCPYKLELPTESTRGEKKAKPRRTRVQIPVTVALLMSEAVFDVACCESISAYD